MSSSWNMKQGPNFVPAYQVSGTPYVLTETSVGTSTVYKVTFPYLTRWVKIRNIGSFVLRVGFTEEGVKGTDTRNFFQLNASTSASGFSQSKTDRWEIKCKELYFLGQGGTTGFSLAAGLTGIESFPVLTGSNGFKGVG